MRIGLIESDAAGQQVVRGKWITPGATMIEVGINSITIAGRARLAGDVDYAGAVQVAGAIPPDSGDVGPMTTACLLTNSPTACHSLPESDLRL